MVDEVVKDNAGSVRTHTGEKGIDHGQTFRFDNAVFGEKEISMIAGTTGSNFIYGTPGADIIVPNGAAGKRPDGLAPRDVIDAAGGKDIVVLGGKQSDWKPRLPGVIDYPTSIDQDFWKESKGKDGAYGRSVVLENVKDGSITVIRDAETIAFADGKLDFEAGGKPGALQPELTAKNAAELEAAINSGTIKAVPAKIYAALAEAGRSPEEIASAKVQASYKAQMELDKIPYSQQKGDMYEVGNQIGRALMEKTKVAPVEPPAPGASAPRV